MPSKLIEDARAFLKEGNWKDAVKALTKAIEAVEAKKDQMKVSSEALRLRSYANTRIGDYGLAVTDARKALEISGGIGDLEGEADALRRLGYVHWRKGDNVLAQEFYNNGLERAAAGKADEVLGRTQLELGSLMVSMKEFAKAERLFKTAIGILSGVGKMEEVARAINNLGSCYMDSGDFEKAEATFKRCMRTSEEIDDHLHLAWGAFNLADTYAQMGQPKRAPVLLEQALGILVRMEDIVGVAATHLVYGKVCNMLKDWDNAEEHLSKILVITKKTPILPIEADARYLMGQTHIGKNEKDRARAELSRSLEIYEGIGVVPDIEKVKDILDTL